MSKTLSELRQVLAQIDRPGSFCVSGSTPALLPGLEVEGIGSIGLPLTATGAKELIKQCEQAPYGKGEKTLVDTKVRRVWRLTPDHFSLTNPDWDDFLKLTLRQVQDGLGLEKQKLESHLYDLLLYEPGSFFLPHRDGEKLDRMVATLVIMLPSSYEGGELVVRHEGQEQVVDFASKSSQFRIHFAAFYADCEHEIRPLKSGYRLCLVYNLTLAKSKKGITAPRSRQQIAPIARLLREWGDGSEAHKLAITLEHKYTQEGLTWDALKGVDRARADVLLEAARQADCRAYLALLTFHESGSAEPRGGYSGGYGRRRGWDQDNASDYEMGEVFDTDLSADHWSDSEGHRLAFGRLRVEETEVLDPESIADVEPEEEFEGYTGNAGMTLDRWYRHGAIFIWPNRSHFNILCDAGTENASRSLEQMVQQWKEGGQQALPGMECITFARAIIARWPTNAHSWGSSPTEDHPLLKSILELDELELIQGYLGVVMVRDASANPGNRLIKVFQKHGWNTFRHELEAIFKLTTAATLRRNLQLFESICLAKPRKKAEWKDLCTTVGPVLVKALEKTDSEKDSHWGRNDNRVELLTTLARALLASDQDDQLGLLLSHVLAKPALYPLMTVLLPALTALQPWVAEHVDKPSQALLRWAAACCEQLEALTPAEPQPPADFRRDASLSCKCAECVELAKFLANPKESMHRFHANQQRRKHLIEMVKHNHCDADCEPDRSTSPHTLVCTKNTASYQARLKKYHEDLKHLAAARAIQASLPK